MKNSRVEVTNEDLDRILGIYNREYHFLRSARICGDTIEGTFKVGEKCPFLKEGRERFQHVSEIELDFCLSQLAYFSIHNLISRGNRDSGGLEFFEIQKNGILTAISSKKFRKPVNPYKEFKGSLEFVKVDSTPTNISLFYEGNFDDNAVLVPEYVVSVFLKRGEK